MPNLLFMLPPLPRHCTSCPPLSGRPPPNSLPGRPPPEISDPLPELIPLAKMPVDRSGTNRLPWPSLARVAPNVQVAGGVATILSAAAVLFAYRRSVGTFFSGFYSVSSMSTALG